MTRGRCWIMRILLALAACTAHIMAGQALQMQMPGFSYYSVHPADTDFSEPPSSPFSTLIPFHMPRFHTPAAYGPQSGFGADQSEAAHGQAIPLVREIFEGLPDEFLCAPLPPVLRVNESLWRIPRLAQELELQSDFDASGLLLEDLTVPPRWPRLPLELTVAGSILFASRGGGSGGCSFAEKSYWAGKAGAAGLVVYGSLGSQDVLYTMGLLPAEFQSFLEAQGESPANYTFPLPSVYVTATSFVNVCMLPFLDGVAKQSIWYRMGQKFLYPDGYPVANSSSSSSSSGASSSTSSSSSGSGASSTGGSSDASSTGLSSDASSSGSSTESSSESSSGGSSSLDSTGELSSSGESSVESVDSSNSSSAPGRRLLSTSASAVSSDSDSLSIADLLALAPPRSHRRFRPWPPLLSKVVDPSSVDHAYQLLADFAYMPLWAIIDPASATAPGSVRIIEQVEYGGFRIAAYFLLVVPGIWILVAVIYAVRKCCQNKRAQQLRELREGAVPVVTFKTVRAGSAAMIAAGAKQAGKKKTSKADAKPQLPPPQPQQQQQRPVEGKEAEEAHQHLRYTQVGPDDLSVGVYPSLHPSSSAEVAIHLSPAAAIALQDDDDDSPPQSPSARLAAASSSQSRTVAQSASPLGNEHEVAAPPATHVINVSSSPVPPADQEVVGVGITARGAHIKLTGSTCAICLLDFSDGDRLKVLPCSHGFHPEGCINPWLEKSDECPVCRASISDALEVEPPCCGWCCDPPRSSAQRFADEQAQRDAVRQRQARREQAEEAERLRELREREVELMPLPAVHPAPQHEHMEGQPHGSATIVDLHANSDAAASSSSSSSSSGLSAEESQALAARFHVESLARCIADLYSTVRRADLTPPAELVLLSDQMLQYAAAARAGRMDQRAAVPWLQRMLGLMPAIHSKLASARSEEAMDAAAVADSMMQFACDEIARVRAG